MNHVSPSFPTRAVIASSRVLLANQLLISPCEIWSLPPYVGGWGKPLRMFIAASVNAEGFVLKWL